MIGLATIAKLIQTKTSEALDKWGRVRDRDYAGNAPPDNPDKHDRLSLGDRYFIASSEPYAQAALQNYRDISRLFVSAAGLAPSETGAFFPPQLIYTKPELGDSAQFDALATQYDELFDGGFAPILKSLHYPAMVWGRSIGEIIWDTQNGMTYAPMIYSRDPQRYILHPEGKDAGIYQKQHVRETKANTLVKMPSDKFLLFSFNPLFNNPYGQSLFFGRTLERFEAYVEVSIAYKTALLRAGSGFLIGEYGQQLRGDTANAGALRDLFTAELVKAQATAALIFDEENKVRAEKIPVEGDAFDKYTQAFIEEWSTLSTGSATGLKQGKYGTYSSEESTTIRAKSEIEQSDAMFMGLGFTYQFHRLFLGKNFTTVRAIPQLQLIRPEVITPTISEAQAPQSQARAEVTVKGVTGQNQQE